MVSDQDNDAAFSRPIHDAAGMRSLIRRCESSLRTMGVPFSKPIKVTNPAELKTFADQVFMQLLEHWRNSGEEGWEEFAKFRVALALTSLPGLVELLLRFCPQVMTADKQPQSAGKTHVKSPEQKKLGQSAREITSESVDDVLRELQETIQYHTLLVIRLLREANSFKMYHRPPVHRAANALCYAVQDLTGVSYQLKKSGRFEYSLVTKSSLQDFNELKERLRKAPIERVIAIRDRCGELATIADAVLSDRADKFSPNDLGQLLSTTEFMSFDQQSAPEVNLENEGDQHSSQHLSTDTYRNRIDVLELFALSQFATFAPNRPTEQKEAQAKNRHLYDQILGQPLSLNGVALEPASAQNKLLCALITLSYRRSFKPEIASLIGNKTASVEAVTHSEISPLVSQIQRLEKYLREHLGIELPEGEFLIQRFGGGRSPRQYYLCASFIQEAITRTKASQAKESKEKQPASKSQNTKRKPVTKRKK